MRRTFLHALTATALASAVAIPVATVALAEPSTPPTPAPVGPLPSTAAQEWSDLVAERGERRAIAARVVAAKERAAERKAAAERAAAEARAEKAAAARRAAAKRAAERAAEAAAERAAEAAAERRAEARAADARTTAPARASRGGSRSTLPATGGSPRTIARSMLAARGQADQFSCLESLWTKESGWSVSADNPTSSAYGIPQALPGSKMASAGSDWRTSARTQITWGLSYIDSRYGSPCAAWNHSQANNWY